MTNIKNQSQFLDNIVGLEDLDHENAAVCSGGRIYLYDGPNQTGAAVSFAGGAVSDLRTYDFNDKASSIKITDEQRWQLWIGLKYTGNLTWYAGPGNYNLVGIYNNSISSISQF